MRSGQLLKGESASHHTGGGQREKLGPKERGYNLSRGSIVQLKTWEKTYKALQKVENSTISSGQNASERGGGNRGESGGQEGGGRRSPRTTKDQLSKGSSQNSLTTTTRDYITSSLKSRGGRNKRVAGKTRRFGRFTQNESRETGKVVRPGAEAEEA